MYGRLQDLKQTCEIGDLRVLFLVGKPEGLQRRRWKLLVCEKW